MAKLFSAGPESKYAVEELDKATQYYTGNPNAKYADLVGPENKPLRVKIRKALEYRGGKFVIPGSLPQDSEKSRTSQKLKNFLKGKTTIKQSELIEKLDELGYKNPKVQVNNIAFDNPQLTVIRDVAKAPQPPRESKLYSKAELDKATRGEHKKNPDRITKTKFDDLNRFEKSKIFTRLNQQGGTYSPFKKINNPLSKETQKDIKNKFANLYDDWDFKNFKFGISNLKDNENVYKKVVNFVKEGKPYELAADLKSADGWMGAQMDRAFRLGDTRYKPIRKNINNKSKIIGFIDNTEFGKGNKYLFADKFVTGSNADGVLMSEHPDYAETKKFRDIANKAKLPIGGALKNILQNKGIDTSRISLSDLYKYMMGEVGIEGTKNAIEQHHIQGVGVRATGDYQLLNRDLNALAREATSQIQSGDLKTVSQLEAKGVQVKVDDVIFGSGSGKASSDFLKIKDQVTDFYKKPEGQQVISNLRNQFKNNEGNICSIFGKANGGSVEACLTSFDNAVKKNPEGLFQKVLNFAKSPGVKTFGAGAAVGAAIGLVKAFRNDDPTTYLSNEDQQKNMLVDMATSPITTDLPRPDILDYQLPLAGALVAGSTAAVAPKTIKASKSDLRFASRSPGVEKKKPGAIKTGFRTLGRGLGVAASPGLLAPLAAMDLTSQISEGDSLEDIATDPFNYLYPTFADQTPKMTRGLPSAFRKIANLGLGRVGLKVLSRAGLAGLGLSLGIQGYQALTDD
jgi:hypothetical protein